MTRIEPYPSPWEKRPNGGAIHLEAPYPIDADMSLELVVVGDVPYWFLHVCGVPFELDAAKA